MLAFGQAPSRAGEPDEDPRPDARPRPGAGAGRLRRDAGRLARRPVAEGRTCGADERQAWVGQSVASLNDIDLPEGARVLFPTTPATMDYNPERLNVSVDGGDAISRVYCG